MKISRDTVQKLRLVALELKAESGDEKSTRKVKSLMEVIHHQTAVVIQKKTMMIMIPVMIMKICLQLSIPSGQKFQIMMTTKL